jgi:hypothetical protein
MFKTARFKVHNPSRHKRTVLLYALTQYHATLKALLERTLAAPDLLELISTPDRKGKLRINGYAVSRHLYTIAPKNWELAPLRDYLINDAIAMLLSHFKKLEKGKNDSNPPTVPKLAPMTQDEVEEATREFTDTETFPIKEQHQTKIDDALAAGKTRVAKRLEKIYQNYAVSKSAGNILRRIEGLLPRPIEFTRIEFARGALIARKGDNYYALVRLFSRGHRYCEDKVLDPDFIDWKTSELVGSRKYSGVILPLELGRDYHEHEYLKEPLN